MSTGNRKVDIYLKKFMPQQEMRDNFLEYLLQQSRQNLALLYPKAGVFYGAEFSSSGPNAFIVNTPMATTDGLGHIMKLDPGYSEVKFENGLSLTYHVGLKYNEIYRDTDINVRTGEIMYRLIEESVGEKGSPNSVQDNGSTLTLIVDSVTEAGVNCSGRPVTIWKKKAVSQVDAFFTGVTTWDGTNNKVQTTHLFGQTAGAVSLLASDYVVFVHGPTVKKNTDLSTVPDYVYLGKVTGNGNGNTPSVFDQNHINNLATTQSLSVVQDILKSFLTGGGIVTWNLANKELTWTEDIKMRVTNRPYDFTMEDQTVTGINDGDVLFIYLDTVGGVKVINKVPNGEVPDIVEAYPIAIRAGNDIFFANGALELKGDASTVTQGRIDGITKDILDFIGAANESDSDPFYTSLLILSQGMSLVAAISLLDAAIGGLLTDFPSEETFEVTNPAGQTVFTMSAINWGVDNSIPDLVAYINGHKAEPSLTGGLDKDYRKTNANTAQFAYTIPEGAKVTFRKERTGAPTPGGGGGQVAVEDEALQITAQLTKLNFMGQGVTATQTAPGVVQVTIPGAGAGAVSLGKLVKNNTGATLPAKSALAWLDDGTVGLSDANVTSLADFAGSNDAAILDGQYGFAAKMGNVPNALVGLGAVPGQEVYLGETPGTFSLTPPPGVNDTVLLLGRAEPPQGIAQAEAVDLWLNPQIISAP